MTHSRRTFLHHTALLGAAGLFGGSLAGCGTPSRPTPTSKAAPGAIARLPRASPAAGSGPPPDLFDAATLGLDFWVKPRTLSIVRPQTGERAQVLYWKDGEVNEAAYQRLCHLLRDVNGRAAMPMDHRLLEVLWATQAFGARFGIDAPVEILSGYRTAASNQRLQEQGVPAARKSLHLVGKAADIRIRGLDQAVLGNLIKSFRQGGVGFYFRPSSAGGWIHTDTGVPRTWKG